jgi:hypothetical protein
MSQTSRRPRGGLTGSGIARALILAGCAALALPSSLIAAVAGQGGSVASASDTRGASPNKVLAHNELLGRSQYPSGWLGEGANSGTNDASFFGGASNAYVTTMMQCLGTSSAGIDTAPAESMGQTYADPNSNLSLSDTVDVFPNQAAAMADEAAAANQKAPGCLVQLSGSSYAESILQSYFGNSATAGTAKVVERVITPAGSRAADIETSFPFTSAGLSGTLYLDQVFVQKGRSESNLWIANTGAAASLSFVEAMAGKAAVRLHS